MIRLCLSSCAAPLLFAALQLLWLLGLLLHALLVPLLRLLRLLLVNENNILIRAKSGACLIHGLEQAAANVCEGENMPNMSSRVST